MIHLVLGGARSGKSRFAERLIEADQSGSDVVYLATAAAGDAEMEERINNHKMNRPSHWQLIEEPLRLNEIILQLEKRVKIDKSTKKEKTTRNNNTVVLIECMTLWLSNWLTENGIEKEQALANWQRQKEAFFQRLQSTNLRVIIVSNEVGSGIVPLGELSRQFADQAGWLNQELAAIADKVTLVVAGLPLAIKTSEVNI